MMGNSGYRPRERAEGADAAKEARFCLSSTADGVTLAAPWIESLLQLGMQAWHYFANSETEDKTVLAVSVPNRDYAAALIGCGWVLASPSPELHDPMTALRHMKSGQPFRAVTSVQVRAEVFQGLDESYDPARVEINGMALQADRLKAVARLQELDASVTAPRRDPGAVEISKGLHLSWDERLALPVADLAIVGTKKWLADDFEAHLGIEGSRQAAVPVGEVLHVQGEKTPTWYTRVYTSVGFDGAPLPTDLNAVILDGNGAVKYLNLVDSPIVICVLDRSVSDVAPAELVLDEYHRKLDDVKAQTELDWEPAEGIEVLGFRTPR